MATRDFEEEIKMMAEDFAKRVLSLVLDNLPREENVKMDAEKVALISAICSALSSPGRIELLITLEKKPRRFKELEVLSGLRGGALKNALNKLIELGLIERYVGLYRITSRGKRILRRIKEVIKYV